MTTVVSLTPDVRFRKVLQAATALRPRFYTTRQSAIGTASYETLLRGRGPIGALTHAQAQAAIVLAAFGLGIARQDASGNLTLI